LCFFSLRVKLQQCQWQQWLLSDAPANHSKYQVKAETQFYPTMCHQYYLSLMFTMWYQKPQLLHFFWGTVYIRTGFLHHGPIPDEYSTVGKSSRETGHNPTRKSLRKRQEQEIIVRYHHLDIDRVWTKPGTVEDWRGLRIVPTPTPATRWFPFRVLHHQLTRGFPVLFSELGRQNELAASKSYMYVFSHFAFSNVIKT
jgi:hypothetical protein